MAHWVLLVALAVTLAAPAAVQAGGERGADCNLGGGMTMRRPSRARRALPQHPDTRRQLGERTAGASLLLLTPPLLPLAAASRLPRTGIFGPGTLAPAVFFRRVS